MTRIPTRAGRRRPKVRPSPRRAETDSESPPAPLSLRRDTPDDSVIPAHAEAVSDRQLTLPPGVRAPDSSNRSTSVGLTRRRKTRAPLPVSSDKHSGEGATRGDRCAWPSGYVYEHGRLAGPRPGRDSCQGQIRPAPRAPRKGNRLHACSLPHDQCALPRRSKDGGVGRAAGLRSPTRRPPTAQAHAGRKAVWLSPHCTCSITTATW